MRTKILVLSIALTLSANLRAQVTIGSVNEPKAGAILDLNSGAKGGLILSNVGLDNPTEIPAGFPGMSGADIAVAKAQLKGAMVYNTNENTCIGVHAWNGDYWERIAPSLVMAPGTTLTSSNAASAFGGDIINFTASLPGAKTYRWYASESNKPYEYLGMTTTNTYSKAFPTGNYKVKAIMDDCHAPAESNELPFAPTSLSPSFGSLNGGNTIYIYGDFPYAATSDYAQLGLVAHYDGINNRDLGDKRHDYNATAWKDLKSGFELARGTGAGQWLSNGFQSLETTLLTTSVVRSFFSNSVPGAYPIGGAARTVEVIFKTPEAANMFTQLQDIERSIFRYGESANHKQFGVLYRGVKAAACPTDNQWMFYAIAGGVSNLITCLSSTPSLETANTINTVTSTYQNNMNDPLTNSYINNMPAMIASRTGALDTGSDYVAIGSNLPYATFLSVRLYDRVLTPEEIEQNALLDQKRYLSPPTVTIDNKNCTEVVVLSPHFLMCKVPPGNILGPKEVRVNGVSYGNVYEYVHPSNDFYISGISSIIDSAGNPLTLTGNNLDWITEVKLGGASCDDFVTTPTSCTFTIPPLSPGALKEVDITITINNTHTYRFAKMFEYD